MNSEKQQDDEAKQDQQQQELSTKENSNNGNSNNEKHNTELTAEWSVRAQLTISRPNVDKASSSSNGLDGGESHKPVKFVYRWSSDDIKPNTTETTTDGGGGAARASRSGQSIPAHHRAGASGLFRSDDLKSESFGKAVKNNDSFHSNLGGGKPAAASDSGFSTSFYNSRSGACYGGNKTDSSGSTRCRSTCSIVLSAVADFLPTCNDIPEENDPFTYNTTTSYTVSPEKAGDDLKASQNFGDVNILALRDAFSQTSDNETKNKANNNNKENLQHSRQLSDVYSSSRRTLGEEGGGGKIKEDDYDVQENDDDGNNNEKKRKFYDYRCIRSESMQYNQTEEGNSKSSFYLTHPLGQQQQQQQQRRQQQQRPFKSKSQSSILPSRISPGHSTATAHRSSEPSRKPPRTVHIDVYCTGSDVEDEDDEDGDESSSPSLSDNPNELESNSTPQTVLDIEQMLLRHHRAGKLEVPRRLKAQQQQQQQSQAIPELGHAITKSNTADEISESKQILFKKHIGDQKNKYFNNLRNRGGGGVGVASNFWKDPSDDCISSNYPNSSRSTMRDLTCSSISSVIASNICEDVESAWKETEPDANTIISLGKSDSFEYDNSIDRLRIKRMERLWSRPPPDKEHSEIEEKYKDDEVEIATATDNTINTSKNNNNSYNINNNSLSAKQFTNYNQQRHIQDFLQSIHLPHITAATQQLTPLDYDPLYSALENQYIEYPIYVSETDKNEKPSTSIPSQQLLQKQNSQQEQQQQHQQQQQSPAQYQYPNVRNMMISQSPLPPPTASIVGSVDTNYACTDDIITGSIYFRHSNSSSEPSRSPDKPLSKTLFQTEYNKSGSEASTMQSNLSGYTSEYLAKARKFGTVITALRKPGHHIGPAKNPECQCEHCRRYMTERYETGARGLFGGGGGGRGRAFSMSDAFNIKQGFWLRRQDM